VFSLQGVSRLVVVKGFFVKTGHFKLAPVVVVMAIYAGFARNFFVSVVALFLFDEGTYFLVAIQTFLVGHLIANAVALGAVAHAFQVFVSFGQWARRNLAEAVQRSTEHKKHNPKGRQNRCQYAMGTIGAM
jgi:hypothetical protein